MDESEPNGTRTPESLGSEPPPDSILMMASTLISLSFSKCKVSPHTLPIEPRSFLALMEQRDPEAQGG